MKIAVIFIDDEVTGTAKASVVYCLTFIFEGNPKFHLDVCENKDVFFFPFMFTKPLNFIHTSQLTSTDVISNF